MRELFRRYWLLPFVILGVLFLSMGLANPDWYAQYKFIVWGVLVIVIIISWVIRKRE